MESQDLRKAGLKVTHPRMRILDVLESTGRKHLTAEDIYRQLLDNQDDQGAYIMRKLLLSVDNHAVSGYASYRWYRPGETFMSEKIAYSRRFEAAEAATDDDDVGHCLPFKSNVLFCPRRPVR